MSIATHSPIPEVWPILIAPFCDNWSLYVLLSFVGAVDTVWIATSIMAAGNALGAFVTGGFSVNHMDVASKHVSNLMCVTNTAGTFLGIIGFFVSGLILALTDSWALVSQVSGCVVNNAEAP